MGKLQLDLACGDYDRVRALRDGEVVPEGIELNFLAMRRPEEIFWRMLVHHEFDASEMSLGSYVAGRARGDLPFIAIPVFPAHRYVGAGADRRAHQLQDLMGEDYWPDGLEPNRHMLATFVRYSYEQGIARREVSVDELFAGPTLDTYRT